MSLQIPLGQLALCHPLVHTQKGHSLDWSPPPVKRCLLLAIDNRKSTGSDDVPCCILNHCAHALAPFLTILINASMAEGRVPSSLKLGNVRPLFKSGVQSIPKNYWPISLLPLVSEIMGKVVLKWLCQFVHAEKSTSRQPVCLPSS
eukprot:scpid106602/ scgid9312/ 